MVTPFGVHWFRRDLRVAGNPALRANWQRHQGRVLSVFFFDSSFLARPDFSHNRFAFFLKTLASLREDLREVGGDLLVLDRPPREGFAALIRALEKSPLGKPASITFNRDYEPFARARDAQVQADLEQEFGVGVHTERDHLLIEPADLTRDKPGDFYQIYSPFARRWFDLLKTPAIQARIEAQSEGLKMLRRSTRGPGAKPIFSLKWAEVLGSGGEFSDQLAAFTEKNARHVTVPIPEAGSRAALAQLDGFKDRLASYQENRDFPAMPGTSRLSIFLKNGSLTAAQVIATLGLRPENPKKVSGPVQYLKELAWREFYYHILYHAPRVENEAFLSKYKDLGWENRKDLFEAWKEGKTGYPIVDAGMRELKQTGFMHNRVRMIVASFLTKDLLVDWRWGERYFMEQLLDGDLAANNGGWQWAASTGCDPQPYFRIFNPTLQSEKFDPEGEYVRRYVPERSGLKGKALHAPIDPIVDHAARKLKAVALYSPKG
ncbi:MAG: deoxyribodipyrimidine photo-lyase [Bacteriovoracia bacterium]